MKITYELYQERAKFIFKLLDSYLNKYTFTVLPRHEMEKTALLHVPIREPFLERIANFLRTVLDCSVTLKDDIFGRRNGYLIISLDTDRLNRVDQVALEHFTRALELAMPKYLMFGHDGVLAGEVVTDLSLVQDDDLVLDTFYGGDARILKNGVQIVHHINELVDYFGYEVVFHSKNNEQDQIELIRKLQAACALKGIRFPNVHAMAVYDPSLYQSRHIVSDCPFITTSPDNILVTAWGDDDKEGNASVRRALEAALHFADVARRHQQEERHHHVVFDEGELNVTTSISEGYQGYLIGSKEGQIGLDVALQQVVLAAREKTDLLDTFSLQEEQHQTTPEATLQEELHHQTAPEATLQEEQHHQTAPEATFFGKRPRRAPPSPLMQSVNTLSLKQLSDIQETIRVLEKEIHSCWPYPNKDRKQIKVNALNHLITLCGDMDVAAAVETVEGRFTGVRDGKISSRTADLLDKLKSDDLSYGAEL